MAGQMDHFVVVLRCFLAGNGQSPVSRAKKGVIHGGIVAEPPSDCFLGGNVQDRRISAWGLEKGKASQMRNFKLWPQDIVSSVLFVFAILPQ